MQRVKRRIFSGVVCEQEVYTVSDRANIKKAEPRPRFKDDEERAQHRIGISKRKHQRLVNENFSPFSLYSTLTFDDDSEVHTFSEAQNTRQLLPAASKGLSRREDHYLHGARQVYEPNSFSHDFGRHTGRNDQRQVERRISNPYSALARTQLL